LKDHGKTNLGASVNISKACYHRFSRWGVDSNAEKNISISTILTYRNLRVL
jgi:hypothetical protein